MDSEFFKFGINDSYPTSVTERLSEWVDEDNFDSQGKPVTYSILGEFNKAILSDGTKDRALAVGTNKDLSGKTVRLKDTDGNYYSIPYNYLDKDGYVKSKKVTVDLLVEYAPYIDLEDDNYICYPLSDITYKELSANKNSSTPYNKGKVINEYLTKDTYEGETSAEGRFRLYDSFENKSWNEGEEYPKSELDDSIVFNDTLCNFYGCSPYNGASTNLLVYNFGLFVVYKASCSKNLPTINPETGAEISPSEPYSRIVNTEKWINPIETSFDFCWGYYPSDSSTTWTALTNSNITKFNKGPMTNEENVYIDASSIQRPIYFKHDTKVFKNNARYCFSCFVKKDTDDDVDISFEISYHGATVKAKKIYSDSFSNKVSEDAICAKSPLTKYWQRYFCYFEENDITLNGNRLLARETAYTGTYRGTKDGKSYVLTLEGNSTAETRAFTLTIDSDEYKGSYTYSEYEERYIIGKITKHTQEPSKDNWYIGYFTMSIDIIGKGLITEILLDTIDHSGVESYTNQEVPLKPNVTVIRDEGSVVEEGELSEYTSGEYLTTSIVVSSNAPSGSKNLKFEMYGMQFLEGDAPESYLASYSTRMKVSNNSYVEKESSPYYKYHIFRSVGIKDFSGIQNLEEEISTENHPISLYYERSELQKHIDPELLSEEPENDTFIIVYKRLIYGNGNATAFDTMGNISFGYHNGRASYTIRGLRKEIEGVFLESYIDLEGDQYKIDKFVNGWERVIISHVARSKKLLIEVTNEGSDAYYSYELDYSKVSSDGITKYGSIKTSDYLNENVFYSDGMYRKYNMILGGVIGQSSSSSDNVRYTTVFNNTLYKGFVLKKFENNVIDYREKNSFVKVFLRKTKDNNYKTVMLIDNMRI